MARWQANSPFALWLKHMAVVRIQQAMLQCGGNQTTAARMLGTNKYTVHRYLKWNDRRLAAQADKELLRIA